ncbi:Cilia- and flagella-associated protein 100 [Tritrichomonas musculus]|uniref:Cilia- and flagella-associated protein 100 n=1 Tax=Tritrichomonas musculus TaxID=1915356 RepID=A0ABR2HF87_9EUKA
MSGNINQDGTFGSKPSSVNSQRSGRGKPAMLKSPFRIPGDNEIFAIRDQQRQEKLEKQQSLKDTKCYMRGLDSGRQNFRNLTKQEPPKAPAEEEALAQLILSPDSNQTSEGLRDYIDQKREIFLAQLSIETKREELQRLEKLEREEEENLKKKEAQINLFRDQFRSFLEADGKMTMEARRNAELKSKQRLEVSLKIKQISTENATLRNEIAHYEEKYQECEEYKGFMESLTPKEWRQEHPLPELYFKEPRQMLDILENLESQNMFLIRHCQEAEEMVERYKNKFTSLLEERDKSIIAMNEKRDQSQKTLEEMREQNNQYIFTGEFHQGNEFSPEEYQEIVAQITEFHNKLGFDVIATYDAATMLRHIEDKMEDLEKSLITLDQKIVKELALEKAHKRRDQERTEKAAKEQKEQEEKTMRALQLAKMPIKKKMGRPLMPRTCLQKKESREKREEQMRLEMAQREADHNLLYGPIWD